MSEILAPLPRSGIVGVTHALVSCPRLTGREKALAFSFAYAVVARAEPRRLLHVPRREELLLELQAVAAAARTIQRDPLEARDEELLALAGVPPHRAHAVNDARNIGRHRVPLPVPRAVPEDRRLVLIVAGRHALLADERRVEELLLPVAVEIGPRNVMRRRELIDLLDLSRLARIAGR